MAKRRRYCSHSLGCPSMSGSRKRKRLACNSSPGVETIDEHQEVAEHLPLRIMPLHEAPAAPAQIGAKLRVIGQLEHGIGERRRIVGRHAKEGLALPLKLPERASG